MRHLKSGKLKEVMYYLHEQVKQPLHSILHGQRFMVGSVMRRGKKWFAGKFLLLVLISAAAALLLGISYGVQLFLLLCAALAVYALIE